ncbi:nucleotidyl transferase AbiEii/AbiGii toxin family protein [Dyadobacter subterraneus]|uniref:Nucleotidyl transferase AbiEii/AbiGii toxin family protein n=1 Tax=Dyadobacter subterraneus TaxID=2773304 RepID=A0ABR9W933_9BACT|nr:nucleotidyl transferase AbiEii/AbiGii toxin family protein [Dyadobacter subterraneus]MBE9461634.1 nucleotidyl transferase AbiEii/AbiGii toxin family protein [Dyadobacter subterraneus]
MSKLYYNTVSELLQESLNTLMSAQEFVSFRLVGGTALSLQLGHRTSIDIDLFSDSSYGSIDFDKIEHFLKNTFSYLDHFSEFLPGMGKSYTIGTNRDNLIKLDIYYTDKFIHPVFEKDTIRMATVDEIVAMKIDVVQRGGRKKDFWDLHELLSNYDIKTMLELHKLRYEFNHDPDLIIHNFIDFTKADNDFDPICLRGKYWEFIKEDIEEAVAKFEIGI